MPAWITSLLREDVTVPIASAASSRITSRPACASRRATARPITPAPITTHSTLSIRAFRSTDSWNDRINVRLVTWRPSRVNRARRIIARIALIFSKNSAGFVSERFPGRIALGKH